MFQRIQELLETFLYENTVLNGEQEKESINSLRGDRKICPLGSPFVITRQAS